MEEEERVLPFVVFPPKYNMAELGSSWELGTQSRSPMSGARSHLLEPTSTAS